MNSLNSKILVIGDVILDQYLYGKCDRISPEAPVPIINFKSEEYLLGGAANVANNLVSLGVDVYLCGVIGNDKNGEILTDILNKKGIKNIFLKSKNRETTVKKRIISGGQQLLRIDREVTHNISNEEESNIFSCIEKIIKYIDCIIISDYCKGFLTDSLLKKIITISKENKIKVLVDPKNPPFSKYEGSFLIKPNRKEAKSATGIDIKDKNTFREAALKIKDETSCEIVIVTMSEDGVGLFDNDKEVLIPTNVKQIFDVTGAGDTFIATLAFGLVYGLSIFESCNLANYASGVVVGKSGCVPIELEELKSKF
jgi:D-beta-D-heptose 7-phosphate kinase/D-beta-D-heptose 1-phosphate adenosyltransferase